MQSRLLLAVTLSGLGLIIPASASATSAAAGRELLIDRILTHSCNRATKKSDPINVHYRGTLEATGAEFDASYNRGQPLTFQLGAGQVIKGWDLGLLDMCPGDKRRLTIPAELGYGSRSMGPIPANSVLVFEVELVSIAGVEEEERRIVVPEADVVSKEDVTLEGVRTADTFMKEAEGDSEAKVAVEKEAEAEAEVAGKVEAEASDTKPEEPVQEESPQEEAIKARQEL